MAIRPRVGNMKTFSIAEAETQLEALLDAARREPVAIRRAGEDIAVVRSVGDYERLKSGCWKAFLDLRSAAAAEAAADGLTEDRLQELLSDEA